MRRSRRQLLASITTTAAALGGLLAGEVPTAHANGRFPAAYQLVQSPEDPGHLVAQVTYGLVSTRNAGATWEWTCERAMGSVEAFDPPVQIAAEGVVFAALLDGLGRSSPDGCDWGFVAGDAEGRFVVDVSVTRGSPEDVIFLTTDGLGDDLFDARVFRSSDGGQTFAQVGEPLPPAFLGATLDVAPSDPERIYVTGYLAEGGLYTGVLGRSEDGGATFTLEPIAGTDASRGPFLAAVDPVDPSVVYVRTSGDGGEVLRSEDGGASWSSIFQGEGALAGFALSPDGATILVGGESDPIHRGPAVGGDFEVVSEVRPRCLAWFDDAVFACGSEAVEGYTIGRSLDEGETFEPLYSRFCTSGPIACASDTSIGAMCDADWEVLRETIDADACFGSGGGGGTGGGPAATGGGAASSTIATTGTGSGGNEAGEEGEAAGCCSVAAGARSRAALPAGLTFAIGLLAAAARRRGRSPGACVERPFRSYSRR